MNARAFAVRLAATLLIPLVNGCPAQEVGRLCEVQPDGQGNGHGDAGTTVINNQALECQTRLCLKQARASSVASEIDTAPFCTAECRNDADCDAGELRNPGNSKDLRCRSGFYCGVALTTGTVACCRKLCLCKDFVGASIRQTPAVCEDPGRSGACGRTGAR